jgi:hypothetical protein
MITPATQTVVFSLRHKETGLEDRLHLKKTGGGWPWRQLDHRSPPRLALNTETTNRERKKSVKTLNNSDIDLSQ